MEFIYEDYGLACPCCGDTHNLHQVSAKVFFRDKEDGEGGVAVECNTHAVQNLSYQHGNPSLRRDGISIRFACEHCAAEPELAIYQHKGSTFIEWTSARLPAPYVREALK